MNRFNHARMGIAAQIPFVDLITPHVDLPEELLAVFRALLRSGNFIGGSMVEDFEREFAQYCSCKIPYLSFPPEPGGAEEPRQIRGSARR